MNRIYVIYSGSNDLSSFPFSTIPNTIVHSSLDCEGTRVANSLFFYYFPLALRILEVRWDLLSKNEKGRGKWNSVSFSLFVSFLNIRESRRVEGSLINDSPDSASDTLRPPGRDIRREKQRGQQHLPPSLCPSLFLALLQTRRTVDRVYPLHAVVDSKLKFHPHARSRTHTCPFCFLVSLSLFFSPLSFSFSFFFFFNFVHSILDTGRGEDMRVPPCRDIGLFSKSSPPPPTAAILSNMKFLTPRVRVFDHAPPG